MRNHFLNLKSLRKILLYAGASILLLLTLIFTAGFLFKDKIISRFVAEANKQLATPVKIGKMEISVLRHFPDMSIEFTDVYVEDSHPEIFPLFTAKKISFSFNSFEAWGGQYKIQRLDVFESETNIRINKKGVGNFQIVKDTVGKGQSVSLDLKNVRLKKQRITYVDESVNQSHEFNSSSLAADITLKDNVYRILASGDAISNQVGIGSYIFLKDKLFNITLAMTYDDEKKQVVFQPSSIAQENGDFDLTGLYDFKNEPVLDLTLNGKKTNLQTIISFLPMSMAESIKKYESVGDLYFKLSVKGNLATPLFNITFGCRNATIFLPETNFKVTQTNLTGTLSTIGLSRFTKATVNLKDVSGKLNGKNFTGNFSLENFEQPFVDFQFKGELDATTIKAIAGETYLTNASGALLADVSLTGEPDKLKKRSTARQVKISGSLEMKNVSLSTSVKGVDFTDVSGNFQFSHNDLAMSNVKGKLGQNDFLLNGFIKNVVSYFLFEDQPIGIEADLKSEFIDLEELLQLGFGEASANEYQFKISPNLHLNFDCQLNRLKYKKFIAEDVDGNLLVKNQTAFSKGIKMKTMGGKISMSGLISSFSNQPIALSTTARLTSIHLDSLFYIFGNFNQNFIQDKHLKGQATADVSLETELTPALKIAPQTLVSNIDILIKKGELNNFAPLQELNKYLDDDGLKSLRFADLKNEIHIENQTVFIPLMEVRSNVTSIQVSGKHTFDQHIDYRIVAPLRNKKVIDLKEAGDAYENLAGKIKVYFKITGTTDNYKVAYDTDAVKKKMASDLKKEVAELKDAFKGKSKKKLVELEKDDFFDWEN